jgi:uncharacterized protein (DUF1499 family)
VRVLFEVFGLALIAIVVPGGFAEGSEYRESMIRPCPNKPNCVSSLSQEGPRTMDPIRYQGSAEDVRQRLLKIILTFPRSTVVRNSVIYLSAEFRSAIFSFVDDVEFVFDDAAKLIHYRSTSRLGFYYFGVNRRRIQTIIRQFLEAVAKPHKRFITIMTQAI